MPESQLAEARKWLLLQWSKRFAEALSGMTGEAIQVEPDDTPPTPTGLVWAQEIAGFEGAVLWVAAPEPVWQAAGTRVLELAGLSESSPADRRSTFLEVLNQSLASLALDVGPDRTRTRLVGRHGAGPGSGRTRVAGGADDHAQRGRSSAARPGFRL